MNYGDINRVFAEKMERLGANAPLLDLGGFIAEATEDSMAETLPAMYDYTCDACESPSEKVPVFKALYRAGLNAYIAYEDIFSEESEDYWSDYERHDNSLQTNLNHFSETSFGEWYFRETAVIVLRTMREGADPWTGVKLRAASRAAVMKLPPLERRWLYIYKIEDENREDLAMDEFSGPSVYVDAVLRRIHRALEQMPGGEQRFSEECSRYWQEAPEDELTELLGEEKQ